MKEKLVSVLCPNGIHISPAGVLAKLLKKLDAAVEIRVGEARADARDVDAVLRLALPHGAHVTIRAEGRDEAAALETTEAVLREGTAVLTKSPAPAEDAPFVGFSPVRIGRIRRTEDTLEAALAGYEKGEPMEEARRFGAAVEAFVARLGKLIQASDETGETRQRDILEGYSMMADAPGFHAEVGRAIKDGMSAPEAVLAAKQKVADDMAIQTRAVDQRRVGRSLARILLGLPEEELNATEPLILVGKEISPELMARLPKEALAGIVEAGGSPSGHAAILARARGIPALFGYGALDDIEDGALAILDGEAKTLRLHPSEDELRTAWRVMEKTRTEARRLAEEVGPVQTRDGVRITLRANAGTPEEAAEAMGAGAEGIGLFRSEMLFLGRDTLPTEDEQAAAYIAAVRAAKGEPCVIRTMDIGGDKTSAALALPAEPNPFLGFRALRVSLARPELLRTQLRAALRAASAGRAKLMLPMVISVEELSAVRALLDEERVALYGGAGPKLPLGIMVETPAAALMADRFAAYVDFFSIGTNDLTQYTLAADRANPAVSRLYDPLHPAVLRLIHRTAQAAEAASVPVSVCGEMAADPMAVPLLIGMGIRTLSMAAASLPDIRAACRGLTVAGAKRLLTDVLAMDGPTQVRAYLEKRLATQNP